VPSKKRPTPEKSKAEYGQAQRDRVARNQRIKSTAAANIGPPPPVDRKLFNRYRKSLWLFLTECFPESTSLSPLSLDHRKVIDRIESCLLKGGRDLNLMPRGFAKTSIMEGAAIWATGFGHRRFVLLLAATGAAAEASLDSIQKEIEENPILMKLFPGLCHPVQALAGISNRAASQHIDGKRTNIEWSAERCVFPTVRNFIGSGAIIWPRSIDAKGLRGMKFKNQGEQVRPDFCLADDLQDDESARSMTQTEKRLSILKKTVLPMGGHGKRLAIVVNGTIIEVEDLIDQLADPKRNPSWRTVKVGMMKSLPTNMKLWLEDYAQIRHSYDPDSNTDRERAENEANAFYLANQEAMDEGAEPTWVHCFFKDSEHSAIQHSLNLICDDGMDQFRSEYMNEPVRKEPSGVKLMTVAEIVAKTAAPVPGAHTVTAFIDVSEQVCYYQTWAWCLDGTGYELACGTYPDQKRPNFSHRDPPFPFSKLYTGTTESVLCQGLHDMLNGDKRGWLGILNMEWNIHGVACPVRLCGVDVNGNHNEALTNVLNASPKKVLLYPSIGRGVGAADCPMWRYPQYKKNGGVENWFPTIGKPGMIKGVMFCANSWKKRFHERLGLPAFTPGGLYLSPTAINLKMQAEHALAEFPTLVVADTQFGLQEMVEFKEIPNRPNHYLDTFVGNLVAASALGIGRMATGPPKPRRRPRTRYG